MLSFPRVEDFYTFFFFLVRTFVIRTPGSNPGKVKKMLRTWPASGPRPYLVKYAVMSYLIVYPLHKVKNKLRTLLGSISRKVKKPEARSICSCSYIKKTCTLQALYVAEIILLPPTI